MMKNSKNHNLNHVRHERDNAYLEAQITDITAILAEAYRIDDLIGIMQYKSRLNDLIIEINKE